MIPCRMSRVSQRKYRFYEPLSLKTRKTHPEGFLELESGLSSFGRSLRRFLFFTPPRGGIKSRLVAKSALLKNFSYMIFYSERKKEPNWILRSEWNEIKEYASVEKTTTMSLTIDHSRQENGREKRQEQLARWDESQTATSKNYFYRTFLWIFPVSDDRAAYRGGPSKIKFGSGAIFLSACQAGDYDEIEAVLRDNDDITINYANSDGLTALHSATIDGNVKMVKYLISKGADINVQGMITILINYNDEKINGRSEFHCEF